MSRLRKVGVCLVLDYFGTGYSSLRYLHRYGPLIGYVYRRRRKVWKRPLNIIDRLIWGVSMHKVIIWLDRKARRAFERLY